MRRDERNVAMGKIVARAWRDPSFKSRLHESPREALSELGIEIPQSIDIAVLENTSEITHLVLCAPRLLKPRSALSDIESFGDTYRDPRLHPLNWISHDPVHTARLKADPRLALSRMELDAPDGMALVVIENTAKLIHLVLPPPPPEGSLSDDDLDLVADGFMPPTLRHAALDGPIDYTAFIREG